MSAFNDVPSLVTRASRLILLTCAALLCLTPQSIRAEDPPPARSGGVRVLVQGGSGAGDAATGMRAGTAQVKSLHWRCVLCGIRVWTHAEQLVWLKSPVTNIPPRHPKYSLQIQWCEALI